VRKTEGNKGNEEGIEGILFVAEYLT